MTTFVRNRWRPTDDYDDEARWLDQADGGSRYQAYGACRDVRDPDRFFPVEVERRAEVRRDVDGHEVVDVVEVPTDVEPPYPPADVKAICDRCPVMSVCLSRNLDEEYGIFGGTTGYQRGLMNKKTRRRRCPVCGDDAVVQDNAGRYEICLKEGHSWEIL